MIEAFPDLKEITTFIYRIAIALSEETEIEFLKTKNHAEKKASSYKVTLGIMPDYSNQNKNGLRVDDVIEGRIAYTIGMQSGDIIVKINECEVSDIYSYMDCLSNFNPGDSAEISFLQGDKLMKQKVTF